MPATQEISEPLIRENIARAISDVLKTMLGRDAKLVATASQSTTGEWPPFPAKEGEVATPQVVGTVGFLGDAKGVI